MRKVFLLSVAVLMLISSKVFAGEDENDLITSGGPVGEIVLWASQTKIPNNYLICDGTELKIEDYKKLFKVIGRTFGGDGVTTFKVPDMRGMFVRGWDATNEVDKNIVIKDGKEIRQERGFGSIQNDAIRNITGTFNGAYNPGTVTATEVFSAGEHQNAKVGPSESLDYRKITFDASNVVPTADENRPKNIALYYIIKYKQCTLKDIDNYRIINM